MYVRNKKDFVEVFHRFIAIVIITVSFFEITHTHTNTQNITCLRAWYEHAEVQPFDCVLVRTTYLDAVYAYEAVGSPD